MKLFYREFGSGEPFVIMHGIFGSSDNWLTQSKMLSQKYRMLCLDLRNHGQSPHDDQFDYPSMVEDLREFIDEHQLKDPIVLGHSMGGKVAMNFALTYPEKLKRLIVVDIAPRAYNLEHYTILDGLKAVPIKTLSSRQEADEALAKYVPEPEVRQFLLKNLNRKPTGGFGWKLNLDAIDRNLPKIGHDLHKQGSFEKPVLFVRGSRSPYIKDSDAERIKAVFPNTIIETLDTGHWVQAEKPNEFVALVEKWLESD